MYTIKPGILVSLKTRLQGGVRYVRTDLDKEREGQAETTRWETERRVANVAELETATKVRSEARYAIARVCIKTPFGLVCPLDRRDELEDAIVQSRALTAAHNDAAEHTRVNVYVLRGEIAASDQEAIRAIRAELAELFEGMKSAINALDPAKIRDAANRAKSLGQMLEAGGQITVDEGVKAARKAARKIVKRVEKAEADAADVLANLQAETADISRARFSFLDMDERQAEPDDSEPMPDIDPGRFALLETEG